MMRYDTRPSAARFALFLTVLLGLQPVVTDLFLTSLPSLQSEFQAPMLTIQATMFGVMIAFGLGQLFWGAWSDRAGRRPILIWGLAIFVISGVLGALAPQIEWLIAARFAQGASVGAAIVGSRAMVRDLYAIREGAQVLARGLTGLGVIALVSPIIGGILTDLAGWRVNMLAISMVGLIGLIMVWRLLPETLQTRNPRATAPGPLLRNYADILTTRSFLAWSLIAFSSYGGLFLLLSGGPFIYQRLLGLNATEFGMVMATGSASYLVGTLLCRRFIPRRGLLRTVQFAGWISLIIGIWNAVLAITQPLSLAAIMVPHLLYGFAHGFHQPCSNAAAPGLFPEKAGTASSLLGLMMATAAVVSGLYLARYLDDGLLPYALGLSFWSLSLCAGALLVLPRHADASSQ
jgi:DHA1 family bicyclomycin/chloramphenicol resistance-like MFS transporter